ncbi:helix-turn-helix domain-containing protein [Pontibacter ummariensis]
MRGVLNKGRHAVRAINRAKVLLLLSAGAPTEEAADKSGAGLSTVYRV